MSLAARGYLGRNLPQQESVGSQFQGSLALHAEVLQFSFSVFRPVSVLKEGVRPREEYDEQSKKNEGEGD